MNSSITTRTLVIKMQPVKDSTHFEINQIFKHLVVDQCGTFFYRIQTSVARYLFKVFKGPQAKTKFPTFKCRCTSLHHFKYALKKKTHKNVEVGSLTTGYLLLVTKPVSNNNRQDLQCVQNRVLRGFAKYLFLVNFFENRSLH